VKREFTTFVRLIPNDGLLVACADDANVREVIQAATAPFQTYGYAEDADWRITTTTSQNGQTTFTVTYRNAEFGTFHTSLLGRHNLLNLLGATAVMHSCGLSADAIDTGFRTFRGVKNRQEVRGVVRDITIIDDFAHHPTAVRETVAAVKARYWPLHDAPSHEASSLSENPQQTSGRLWSVFEPATAATRRDVFQQEYVEAFLQTDVAIIADVNRLDKAPEGHRFSTDRLVRDLRDCGIEARHISGVEHIVEYLTDHVSPGDVVLIMSNTSFGSIHDKLLNALQQKYERTRR